MASNATHDPVDLALDTNVVLEISTIADMNRAATTCDLLPQMAKDALLNARRQRAASSLALAWHLHRTGKTTVSLQHEVREKTVEMAEPDTPGGDHTWFFTWFLKDYVLSDWNMMIVQDGPFLDEALGGNARDRLLVQLAQDEGVCVVSNEVKAKGALAKEAVRRGLAVYTPSQYLDQHHQSETRLTQEFLRAIGPALIRFLVERDELSPKAIDNCAAYYRVLEYLLTGE